MEQYIYIGTDNEYLLNANITYNALINSTTEFPTTTAAVEKAEDDNSYTFTVTPEVAYENCIVYVALYDSDGRLIAVKAETLATDSSTTVSVDKNDNADTAKVFVWGNTIQAIVDTVKFEL